MSEDVGRRRFCLSAGGLVAGAFLGSPATAAPTANPDSRAASPTPLPRPNILWLVSEDNGPFLGAYGDPLARTPNLDVLAKRGIVYRKAYANAPVCSVSRFGILTGVYPQSCGAAQNHRTRIPHPPVARPFPAYLRNAGYYCVNNYKTDYNTDIDPNTIWDDSSQTAHWRNRPAGVPFMAVFNYLTTHSSSVFTPTEGRVAPNDVRVPAYLPDTAAVRRDISSYYNRMEVLDRELGARLAELEADGLLEDTIIFYFSDHGGVWPGTKQFVGEAGLRVPLIVALPPRFAHLAPSQNATGEIVNLIDLPATVLALAGLPTPPQMRGRAFLGGTPAEAPTHTFAGRNRIDERIDFVRSVSDGRFRYIRNYMPDRPWGLHDGFMWQAGAWQSWETEFLAGRLNPAQARFFRAKPYEELYDLARDPDQLTNLVGGRQVKAKLEELRSALDAHMVMIDDNGFIPEGADVDGAGGSRAPDAYPLSRIMDLAGAAAAADPTRLRDFEQGLKDDNQVVRFWCARGLLRSGLSAARALPALLVTMEEDASPHVRIVAAEAVAGLGHAREGVQTLTRLLDADPRLALKLYALNGLEFCAHRAPEIARPSLERWAHLRVRDFEFDYWTVRSLSRYLLAKLSGSYKPSYITFGSE